MDRCLVFDIWGGYGHFRKFYTTSSPLTHAFPPKTAVWGMIGAIAGLDKSSYLDAFQGNNVLCGVRIMAPVKKTRLAVNFIDTKNSKRFFADSSCHTQVNMELLKRPKFRVYFCHPDNSLYNIIKSNLEAHKSYYTLCLGLSEYLAQFQYSGEFGMKHEDGKEGIRIHSVVPMDQIVSCQFEDGYEYFKETVPAGMNPERQPTGYQKVIYERSGRGILCSPKNYYRLESGENVIFL